MKKYYKDYKLEFKKLPNGKIKQVPVYIGRYYICRLNKIEIRKYKLYFLTLALCSGATALGAGFLTNPGSRKAYVALPYVSLFLPIVFCLLGTIGFLTSSNKLEQAKYDKTKRRIYRSIIWQIVLSSLAIIGDVMFVIFGNKGIFQKELIFCGCMIIILVLNVVYLQLQKKVIYQVEDSDYSDYNE